jgi:hypothetical protein
MVKLEPIKQISLLNFVSNILHFLKREDDEVKIILHSITENQTIFMEDFSEKNSFIEKKAWENIILWLENKGKDFSTDISNKMNGAIAIKTNFNKIGCSIYGLPNLIENVFVSIKILEFYTKIEFEKILENLEEKNAPLQKEKLIEMNSKCEIK